MSEYTTVAQVGTIAEGCGMAFEVNGKLVAVFNDGGEYFAITDFCPHMGASLAEGALEDGIVACPWHAWRFAVRDGTWCDNRRIKIDSYAVRVQGQDIQVLVPDDEPPTEERHEETP